MASFVQFGAGNIGRGFLGSLFSRAGFEVVFVDVDSALVEALNRRRSYPVVVREFGKPDRVWVVERVRAVDGRDQEAVVRELVEADYLATSVGKAALPSVAALLAEGLKERLRQGGGALDLLIAENLPRGAEFLQNLLVPLLPPAFPLDLRMGLVETSIGKMVPLMTAADLAEDRLRLFTEAYDTLVVDRLAFLGPIPPLPGLQPVENIRAYVDLKLFLHNLGHVAAAYLGCREHPDQPFLWQVLEDPAVEEATRAAMEESALALQAEYPRDLTADYLADHVEDLLRRFKNRSLGDTVYRVGRDLARKLGRTDRIVGALLLAVRHGRPRRALVEVYRAALGFQARDEKGIPFAADEEFHSRATQLGIKGVLREVSGLDENLPGDRTLVEEIMKGSYFAAAASSLRAR